MNEPDLTFLARYIVAKLLARHETDLGVKWKDLPGLTEDDWHELHAEACLIFRALADAHFAGAGARGVELFRQTA